jgi:hypothetical protein
MSLSKAAYFELRSFSAAFKLLFAVASSEVAFTIKPISTRFAIVASTPT